MSLILWPLGGSAACKVSKTPDLPITMSGTQPMITAKINGADVQFVLDSGAFYSMISSATAAQFKLPLTPGPDGLHITGVGGLTAVSIARVKVFTIAGVPIQGVEFLVGGSEVGGGSAGALGQNFLQMWDVEYDLAGGAIRLLKADDCKHAMLAYWAKAGQAISTMDINWTTPAEPLTIGTAYLNDTKVRVIFDTGAGTSIISLKAAARAGVTPETPGVADGGYGSGFGRRTVKTFIAPFASFKIGDNEEIKNTRLRIGDIDLSDGVEMLIGADFFLSHRVYVANSQRRLYFTYNGGPVFNLQRHTAGGPATEEADASTTGDQPTDAATFFRRGTAFAGRGDFDHAIADFTRACELNADEPEYFVQRGMAYWRNKQSDQEMADLDRALKLNSGYLPALVSRAELKFGTGNVSGATVDLQSADGIAPKQADIRFTMGHMYEAADLMGAAIAQFDLWILNHPDDSKMPQALNARCWARAKSGLDLTKALSDCGSALRRTDRGNPEYARVLDSRGLVYLRLGAYGEAIADYDASLTLRPKNAWSLYGRGLAKSKLKTRADGEADLAAAAALYPSIAAKFAHYGIAQ